MQTQSDGLLSGVWEAECIVASFIGPKRERRGERDLVAFANEDHCSSSRALELLEIGRSANPINAQT